MDDSVLRLYPTPAETRPLAGLYLAERLPAQGARGPFVYTNFISSLDGRISQPDPGSDRRRVPPAIANPHDWRLYLELLAQADVLISSAAHLRAVVAGRRHDLLAIPALPPDLLQWRQAQGLPAPPACVVVSAQLQIPVEAARLYPGPLLVVTGDAAPPAQRAALERAGIEVIRAGAGPRLDGGEIIRALADRGYTRVYSVAGPRILYTLLQADVLDRLYLTLAHTVLAGERYDTLSRGAFFSRARAFRLESLFLDPSMPEGAGQLLASFSRPQDRPY